MKAAKKPGAGAGGVPDKNQAFEEFKETDGKELNKALRENSASLKERRQKQKDLAVAINTSKKQIDDLKTELETRREQVQEGQTDEEEFAIVRSLKGAKAEYRQAFEVSWRDARQNEGAVGVRRERDGARECACAVHLMSVKESICEE